MGSRSAQTASSGRLAGPPHIEIPKEMLATPALMAMDPPLQRGPFAAAQSSYSALIFALVTLLSDIVCRSAEKKAQFHPWSSLAEEPHENPVPAYPRPEELLQVTIFPS